MTSGERRRVTARGEATRARMISSAADLMYVRGVNAVTLDDVRAATGTSKSQLYKHFPDGKPELVRAVVALRAEQVLAREEQRLARLKSMSGLRRWRDALVQGAALQGGAYGCALGNLVAELSDQDDQARASLSEHFATWESLLAAGFRRMQDDGILPADAGPDALATGLMAALQGGYLLAQANHDVAPMAGNFSLGLGLGSHQPERQAFGTSWPNTITRLREHLTVLRSIFDTGAVDFSGNEISAHPGWPVRVAGGTPVPVYVAAMGPKALQVTGELADGTLPYLAGPRTIAEFIEPAISKAAADAGRRKPRIIAQVPAILSDNVDAAKNFAVEQLTFYEAIPSYQKVIAREGIASAADLAAVGSTESVRRQLQRYLDAGATDVVLSGLAWTNTAVAEELWSVAASI